MTGTTESGLITGTSSVRVVVFNDHPVFRSALSWKLGDDSGIRVIADAASLYETLSIAGGPPRREVQAVVADLRIGDGNTEGVKSVRKLVKTLRNIPVVVFSDLYSSSFAMRMRDAGAAAVVQKSASVDDLAAAILKTVSGASTGQGLTTETNGRTAA